MAESLPLWQSSCPWGVVKRLFPLFIQCQCCWHFFHFLQDIRHSPSQTSQYSPHILHISLSNFILVGFHLGAYIFLHPRAPVFQPHSSQPNMRKHLVTHQSLLTWWNFAKVRKSRFWNDFSRLAMLNCTSITYTHKGPKGLEALFCLPDPSIPSTCA